MEALRFARNKLGPYFGLYLECRLEVVDILQLNLAIVTHVPKSSNSALKGLHVR